MIDKKLNSSDKIMTFLLFVVIAVIPLVCKANIITVSPEEYGVIRSSQSVSDFFSYSKSVMILIMGVVISLFMAFQILGEDGFGINFKSKPVFFALIYLIFALISSLFSGHLRTSFFGITERFEGFFVWACYMVFMIVAMAYSSDFKRLKIMMYIFFLSGLFVGLFGFLQFVGVNPFENELYKKLVLGGNSSGIKIKFDSVFATLYNPNCAGMFFGMLGSMFAILGVYLPKSKLKFASILLAILLIICTIGANSVGGLLGLFAGVGFIILISLVCLFKKKRYFYTSLVILVLSLVSTIALFATNATIVQKFNIIVNALSSGEEMTSSASFYEDIEINGMRGDIFTKAGVYSIDYNRENTQLLFNGEVLVPESQEKMESNETGTKYVFNSSGLTWNLYLYQMRGKDVYVATLTGVDSTGYETSFIFGEVDGKLTFLDKFGYPLDINKETKSFGFEGIERLGSNRGYIWSRSIPLLFKNIIIGAGVDNFVFEFPQDDAKDKLVILGNPYVIVDKPHNFFLQVGINTGLLSLVLMVAFFGYYIIQTIKLVVKENNNFLNSIRLAIVAGVIAYLACGMTTDSVVSVSPVFWALIGAGFGANFVKGDKGLEKANEN